MKSAFLVAIVALATVVNPGNSVTAAARQEGSAVSAQASASFGGTWKGSVNETIGKDADPFGSGTMTLTLVNDSGDVRGVWSSVNDYGEFQSGTLVGTIRGTTMTFSLTNSASGLSVSGKAAFDGANLVGSFVGVFPNPERDRVTGTFALTK